MGSSVESSRIQKSKEARPAQEPEAGKGEEVFPRRFGKYTLLRRLAVGGMAELFLALQRSVAGFEKLIVVKRILPHLAKDRAFVDLILHEARISATLNHPNICHIYDVGEQEGQFYIAMEYIHGEDLRSIIRQMKKKGESQFPLEQALAIVLGCCAGLAYAHEKTTIDGEPLNIVHRDVSPQNILVTFSGDVKLVDFGIAKAGRNPLEDTSAGVLAGKIPYMSPEQASGLPLDARSDLFSLGIILFELTTGKRLFKGPNELETIRLILDGEYPRPRELNPQIPEELEAIIVKALQKDPDKRFQSAREMQAAIEDFVRKSQLKVSTISTGEWMQRLFAEKLEEQRKLLAQGRQLAEILVAQAEAEEKEATLSGVRSRPATSWPWIAAIGISLTALGVALFAVQAVRNQPASPKGPGQIHVLSDPPGAAIAVDGVRRPERTPAVLKELPLAKYVIQVSSDGHLPKSVEVELTEQKPHAKVEVRLERISAAHFAVVNVSSKPSGAKIIIDGKELEALTPYRITNLEPGVEHTIAVSREGWLTQTRSLTLKPGQVEDLFFTLERAPIGQD
ncbi:MAG: protein kinase, partial [Sandaracinaceae bacterium]|nr:protein kinase [Sandaracinaceae bacterium]